MGRKLVIGNMATPAPLYTTIGMSILPDALAANVVFLDVVKRVQMIDILKSRGHAGDIV
jgi:hypothetical protein